MKKVKKPRKKGIAHVPFIMQLEALECGAACLAMVMAYYGKWVTLEQVRLDCGISRNGANARNLLRAARNYGFTAQGFRAEPDSLHKEAVFPCIIHWEMSHFVVLCGFNRKGAVINDPARGIVHVPMEKFNQAFTGVILLVQPGENFEPVRRQKSAGAAVRRRLKGAGSAIVFVALTSIFAYCFSVINPVFTQVFVDRILTHRNANWLFYFFFWLSVMTVLQIALEWLKAGHMLRIKGKLGVLGNTSYMWKLMHLPMNFFSQRMAGDLLQRQSANAQVAETLVNTIAPQFINTLMMILYLVIMVRHSLVLALVGVTAVLLNVIISRIISKQRTEITRIQLRDSGKLAATAVSGIEMIESIKASGAENGYFMKWAAYQASVNKQIVKYTKLNARLGLLPSMLNDIANDIVLVLGVWIAIRGHMTIGALLAFQSLLNAFVTPATQLISFGQVMQEIRTQMERIDDVMEYPDDVSFRNAQTASESCEKLKGNVELKHVTFGYAKFADPLIRDFSVNVKAGQRIALVGASGCGKSTIARLISGLYQPWSGEILFDGKPAQTINHEVFTGSVAVVDQEITLFADTINNNIKMWDRSIENFEVILAARDAQVHDDILMRQGGYEAQILEGGKNLSGGQRQRLEIARVLAQDPSILILDEATSALDAKTEASVIQAIRNRGITCIIVAHRLSTIRDCDEIIVLQKGEVIERGTHETLLAQGGYYTQLISSN